MRIARHGAPVLLFLLVLAAWQWLVTAFRVETWLLPSPIAIVGSVSSSAGLLGPNLVVTLEETLVGFFLSLVAGVLVAGGMHLVPRLRDAVYPWVIISQTVPIIAIAPLLVVWFGFGPASKIIVVVLFAFFPIVVNTYDGLTRVPQGLVRMARTFGASRWQVFRRIEAMWALPALMSGVRIAITYSVVGAVVGEWVGSEAGLGYLLIRASSQLETELLFADVMLLALLGLALFGLAGLAERIAVPWVREERMISK